MNHYHITGVITGIRAKQKVYINVDTTAAGQISTDAETVALAATAPHLTARRWVVVRSRRDEGEG